MKKLTLKYLKKEDKVFLSFKKAHAFWSQNLCVAFLVALLLHIVPLVVFQIDLGTPPSIFFPSSPSIVTAQMPSVLSSIVLPPSKKILHALPAKKIEGPEISISPFPNNLISPPVQAHTFLSIDSFLTHAAESNPSNHPIEASLSFNQEIKIREPQNLKLFNQKPCQGILSYRASVEKSCIIWLKWEKSTGESLLDKRIEHFLKNIQLDLPKTPLYVAGKVEVEFKL